MNIPEYITKEEVRRVCSAIGIRDWTAVTEAKVKMEQGAVIQKLIGGEALAISSEDFRDGLEVELEHGLAFSDANVTNNQTIRVEQRESSPVSIKRQRRKPIRKPPVLPQIDHVNERSS
jgi:hypothetical protein